jgi:hypothetical protein
MVVQVDRGAEGITRIVEALELLLKDQMGQMEVQVQQKVVEVEVPVPPLH